jgi:hypothetical protein
MKRPKIQSDIKTDVCCSFQKSNQTSYSNICHSYFVLARSVVNFASNFFYSCANLLLPGAEHFYTT